MNLNKKSLDYSYKILANVGITNYNAHIADVKRILLAAFVDVYIKARDDQKKRKDYDPATQQFSESTQIPTPKE